MQSQEMLHSTRCVAWRGFGRLAQRTVCGARLPALLYARAYSTSDNDDQERKLRLQFLQADIDKAIAEAEKVKNEAELLKAKKVKNEAELLKAKNEAELLKVKNEAELLKAKNEAENNRQARLRKAVGWGLFVGGIFILTSAISLDYFFHETDWYLKRRIRNKASSFYSPALPTGQYLEPDLPLVSSNKPTLLVGPTGCGKTTIMVEMLRKHVQNNGKGLLFCIRGRDDRYDSGAPSQELLDWMLKCTGVPVPSSWLLRAWSHWQGEKVDVPVRGTGKTVSVTVPRHRISRVKKVLSLVFECAEEDFLASGGKKPWLLCLDEIEDLGRADRNFRFGAADVLQYLGSEIVKYTNDKKAVHVVAAGSSNVLADAFEQSAADVGSRWKVFTIGDLPEAFVRNRLQALAYSTAEIDTILLTFGTRGRLVETFLSSRISNVDESVHCAIARAKHSIARALVRCSPSERETMCKIAQTLTRSSVCVPDVPLSNILIENFSEVFFYGPTGFQWQSVLACRAFLASSLCATLLSNKDAVVQGGKD